MAINTFGVTPAVIASRAHNLGISVSSAPDSDAVEDMIDEVAAAIGGECEAVGISASAAVDSGATQSLYLLCRSALINGVIDRLILSRNPRGAPVDRPYRALYDEAIDQIRRRPQTVSSESGVDVTVDLGASQYRDRTLVPGIAGKIIRGGL